MSTRKRAQRPAPTTAPLPLVLDLVLQRKMEDDHYEELDDRETRLAKAPETAIAAILLKDAMANSYDRSEALTEMAKSISAKSLGDAAAHLALVYSSVDDFETFDLDEHQMAVRIRHLRRCVISALRVVAEATDVSVSDIGGKWLVGKFERRFPSVGKEGAVGAFPST